MKYVFSVVKILIIVVLVLFCVFNRENITIIFIEGIAEVTVPAFLPAIAGIFIGAAAATLAFASSRISLGKENKNLKKQLAETKQNIEKLQNLPLMEKQDNSKDSI